MMMMIEIIIIFRVYLALSTSAMSLRASQFNIFGLPNEDIMSSVYPIFWTVQRKFLVSVSVFNFNFQQNIQYEQLRQKSIK